MLQKNRVSIFHKEMALLQQNRVSLYNFRSVHSDHGTETGLRRSLLKWLGRPGGGRALFQANWFFSFIESVGVQAEISIMQTGALAGKNTSFFLIILREDFISLHREAFPLTPLFRRKMFLS